MGKERLYSPTASAQCQTSAQDTFPKTATSVRSPRQCESKFWYSDNATCSVHAGQATASTARAQRPLTYPSSWLALFCHIVKAFALGQHHQHGEQEQLQTEFSAQHRQTFPSPAKTSRRRKHAEMTGSADSQGQAWAHRPTGAVTAELGSFDGGNLAHLEPSWGSAADISCVQPQWTSLPGPMANLAARVIELEPSARQPLLQFSNQQVPCSSSTSLELGLAASAEALASAATGPSSTDVPLQGAARQEHAGELVQECTMCWQTKPVSTMYSSDPSIGFVYCAPCHAAMGSMVSAQQLTAPSVLPPQSPAVVESAAAALGNEPLQTVANAAQPPPQLQQPWYLDKLAAAFTSAATSAAAPAYETTDAPAGWEANRGTAACSSSHMASAAGPIASSFAVEPPLVTRLLPKRNAAEAGGDNSQCGDPSWGAQSMGMLLSHADRKRSRSNAPVISQTNIRCCIGCGMLKETSHFQNESETHMMDCCLACCSDGLMQSTPAGLLPEGNIVDTDNLSDAQAHVAAAIFDHGRSPKDCSPNSGLKLSHDYKRHHTLPAKQHAACRARCSDSTASAVAEPASGLDRKTCCRCKQEKPVSSFNLDRGKLDGLYCYCRACCSEANTARNRRKAAAAKPVVVQKVCKRCRLPKGAAQFYRQPSSADGLRGWCKMCYAENDALRRKMLPRVEQPTVSHGVCRRCNICKPVAEFFRQRTSPTGIKPWCKACYAESGMPDGPAVKRRSGCPRLPLGWGRPNSTSQAAVMAVGLPAAGSFSDES